MVIPYAGICAGGRRRRRFLPRSNVDCSPGLSACSGSAFTEAQDCSPAHGTCTLMQTNDLALGAPNVNLRAFSDSASTPSHPPCVNIPPTLAS
jgi:hypothetical protein